MLWRPGCVALPWLHELRPLQGLALDAEAPSSSAQLVVWQLQVLAGVLSPPKQSPVACAPVAQL